MIQKEEEEKDQDKVQERGEEQGQERQEGDETIRLKDLNCNGHVDLKEFHRLESGQSPFLETRGDVRSKQGNVKSIHPWKGLHELQNF